MSVFDSFFNVEEWISEHYFTADKGKTFGSAQRDLVREWKGLDDSPSSRFAGLRGELIALFSRLTGSALTDLGSTPDDVARVSALLRQVCGYGQAETELTFERGHTDYTVTGVRLAEQVLWLTATPPEGGIDDLFTTSRLLGNYERLGSKARSGSDVGEGTDAREGRSSGTERGTSRERAAAPGSAEPVGAVVSNLYLSDPTPDFIVISAGPFLVLTERERWPEGRYLAADVQLIAERNDVSVMGEVNRLLAVFSRSSLMPGPDGTIWWSERLDESRQHAVGVSQDLRDGIRESIEIIANDVLARRAHAETGPAQTETPAPEPGAPQATPVTGPALARQSLRFLYRILFLLYAEASPELGVLPKGAGEYDAGYGLDRLRELVQVELSTQRSQQGTHLYESLNLLFRLVNGDLRPREVEAPQEGLVFEPLQADLFAPNATALIDEVGLSNLALQRVLERLLLSKRSSGERGFISYANLGINQLGAVYEGLMSYTGFIATEDLIEVSPNLKDGTREPLEQADSIDQKFIVRKRDELTGESVPVIHRQGSFVYRLAGRERQQSASYYSPEVLTRFVVGQALEELLTDSTPADDTLSLTICEPALGSGAFAIEAVRQLAAEYLARKQRELGEEIPAEDYPLELQRVKAQIALHQVYGVDLNATAVELAEVSLWLDTMQPGLHAPWFGLHLRRGNSLIGARRAAYSPTAVNKKAYLSEAAEDIPFTDTSTGRIYHFLLPASGWGAAANAKELKDIADLAPLKAWARTFRRKLTKAEQKRLVALSQRVDALWELVRRRMRIAESEARRFIDYWPHTRTAEDTRITRAQIEEALHNPDGAYQRLRRVMDAWCALWFWPVGADAPSFDAWLDALEAILGVPAKARGDENWRSIADADTWEDLATAEELDLSFAGAQRADNYLNDYAWLRTCAEIADKQGFFHWELDFASVFERGGFDLQVGNPPWVRPRSNMNAVFAELDVWFQLVKKPPQAQVKAHREALLERPGAREFITELAADIPVTATFLGADSEYPLLRGLQPDLYRCFMTRTWSHMSDRGVVSLIHPCSHFNEKKAASLRTEAYLRQRRHWQFINELILFEIHHHVIYGVHVYGPRREKPSFLMATSLYHPDTVERSLQHDGSGLEPGLKDPDNQWDTRPHRGRILHVDETMLANWASLLDEPDTPPLEATMVFPVNQSSAAVLNKLAHAPRIRDLDLGYSRGWDEAIDRKKGYFEVGSRVNDTWDDVILQGPFFQVASPLAQQPNPTMRNNLDYTELDLEALPADFIPRTSYQPNREGIDYDADYGTWEMPDGSQRPVRDFYRIAWRYMAAVTGVRTFYPTIIPPGTAHVNGVYAAGDFRNGKALLLQTAVSASIVSDFLVKTGGAHISFQVAKNLPSFTGTPTFHTPMIENAARLNCLTEAYAPLWKEAMGTDWTINSPARNARERRRLLVELDALAALEFGLTADELCTIYRTQFSVLYHRYEKTDRYDANGRLVPKEIVKLWEKHGDNLSREQRTWVHPQSGREYVFELPFQQFDREEDMRAAYARFAPLLEEPRDE
ncbi:MAG: class I SAM-dependent DNA methyltransferase [Bowdeniella nasicola]|nr:class I SAM-dependent DNA methyltransferase [Bowdeniella nasicola]